MKRTPLRRKKYMKRGEAHRATGRPSQRFKKRRSPAWCAIIRGLLCEARHGWWQFPNGPTRQCQGRVECAHVRTRAAGAYDEGETLPLCTSHHRQQHAMGVHSFGQAYGLDLAEIAAELYRRHLAAVRAPVRSGTPTPDGDA